MQTKQAVTNGPVRSVDMSISGSRFKTALTLSLFSIFITPFVLAETDQALMVFAVSSEGKPSYYENYWRSLVEQVSTQTGQNIEFVAVESADEFEENLSKGTYDFVLLNAHQYTDAHDTLGYQAFAKEKDHKDTGVIVVHRDSDIRSLEQLKSKKVAISDPRRYTSAVYTQAHLNKEGIPVDANYVDNDKSVYHAVVQKESIAGAGEASSLNDINPNAHAKLRVIWSSKQYSSNAFAAHPRVSDQQVARVKDALLKLNSDSKGKRLLGSLRFKGIDSASDNEWNDVRQLKQHLSQ